MLDIKIHNREARPLERQSAILKADTSLMSRIAAGVVDLMTPPILVSLAAAAAIAAYGFYLGHL